MGAYMLRIPFGWAGVRLLFSGAAIAAVMGPALAEEVLRVTPKVLEFHQSLVRKGTQSVMTLSKDGYAGGAYCEVGSDIPCGPGRLKDRALQNCRRAGGSDCFVFAVNDKIVVAYEVVQPRPQQKAKNSTGDCLQADGSRSSRGAQDCTASGGTYTGKIKTAESLALEKSLHEWIAAHNSDFRHELDDRLQGAGDLPESGLRVHKVQSVQVTHRKADEYELLVSYVLTRSGLPATSSNYNRPLSEYALTKSFPVRFAGSDLSFL